jgi:DNA ligase-1
MLSATPKKPEDEERLSFPALVSPKLDGIRVVIHEGRALTRKLLPVPNRHISALLSDPVLEGLDGEIVVLDDSNNITYENVYNATSSGVMSHAGSPRFRFVVFDDFSSPHLSYPERLYNVCERTKKLDMDTVGFLPHVGVGNLEELYVMLDQYLEMGFEGLMYRNIHSPYKTGRATIREGGLVKFKKFLDTEAVIVGFEERYSNKNEATVDERGYTKRSSHQENQIPMDTLGALIVRCPEFPDVESFKIGSGFDDAQRARIWSNQDLYLGKTVTFKYQPFGVLDRPRFPIFLRFVES